LGGLTNEVYEKIKDTPSLDEEISVFE